LPISKERFIYILNNLNYSNRFLTKQTLKGPINIFLALLQDDSSLRVLNDSPNLKIDVSHFIANIWKPNPKRQGEIEKKEKLKENFNEIIDSIIQLSSRFRPSQELGNFLARPGDKICEESLTKLFEGLDNKFAKSKSRMKKKWEDSANPFLTSFIEESWEDGISFQIGAKTASSVETIWGSWIEQAIFTFNPDLFYIAAGGMDFVLGQTAFDVKAGPQVMNKDQVEEAKSKNRVIKSIQNNSSLSRVIGVKEFKIAISYGRREIAWPFMANAGDLIIYGPETWNLLTGDEWNAFKLFLRGIEFKIENGGNWSKKSFDRAVQTVLKSFYGDDNSKFDEAMRSFDW